MAKSLLFIPDISGYTNFIQSTEIEHSEHVIAEILEVLIEANQEELNLAEIEGDALFFYKERDTLDQHRLLLQIEKMYTAFFSHLKMLERNRICTCNACATAPNLRLKIIVHCGDMQFLKVKGSKKPFGNAVILAHRLLKNSVQHNNYVVLTQDLVNDLSLDKNGPNNLFEFKEGSDEYDGSRTNYWYSLIDKDQLKLNLFQEPIKANFKHAANVVIEDVFNASANKILESVTNYKYRHLWVEGVDSFDFNENEVTRLGTEHVCNINGKQLNFVTVTKEVKADELVYGELTKSPPPVDELYTFYILNPISDHATQVKLEVYWIAKSPLKKFFLALFLKSILKKNASSSFSLLKRYVEERA